MWSEWIIPIAYLAAWVVTMRAVAMRITEKEAREEAERRADWRRTWREPHYDDGKPLVDGEGRALNLVMGFMLGMVWPLTMVGLLFARTMITPAERIEAERLRMEADRKELEQLRRLAREHDLPMPGA